MSLFYYLSSFDPIVDSDISFLKDPGLYFPVLKEKAEPVFLPLHSENDSGYQKEMISSLYPDAKISTDSIRGQEDLLSFLEKMDKSCYLVTEEEIIAELFKEKTESFLFSWPNVLLLSEVKKDSPQCSKLQYCGERERRETRKGSYLWTQEPVLDLIGEHSLYFMQDIRKRISTHRYLHSLSVAKTAYMMANRNGLDPILCYHAGLLHDMAKDYDKEKAIQIMEEHYPSFLPCPDFALHQFIGAYLAKTIYHAPRDVIDMIQYHCTGKAEMTKYMKCLYSADEVEPLREFETEEKRRRCMENLDDGFVYLVKKQLEYFQSRHIDYNEYFLASEKYRYYLNIKE